MDFSLPPEDDPRRVAVRRWLADHPRPSPSDLARAGYVAPAWPAPWGTGAEPEHQLVIAEELDRAGIDPHGHNPIGIGWAGPTILAAGTASQKDRYLWPLLEGTEFWCQLFSEPGSGSDLASLQTRAERDGDEYVLNGQKVWNTYAERSQFGILLARTDPAAPRHHGIGYFICPMDTPGIEVRTIRQMTSDLGFCEVFFTDARIPAENLVGPEDAGWTLAKLTLGNERVTLSSGGVLWGQGPETSELVERVRGVDDPLVRDKAVRLHIEAEVIRLLGYRSLTQLLAGRGPGPEAAVKKYLADRHGQEVMDLAKDASGPAGMLDRRRRVDVDEWDWGFLYSRALTIGGGTTQVLANIIAETILGLPREVLSHKPRA
jgi:alkylation response protein AidB-like acyl-CoA dehydrogenase